MKLVVGAPVAERAWILPDWFSCLEAQSLAPSEYCFVYSKSEDGTLDWLQEQGADHGGFHVHQTKLPFCSRDARNEDKKDPWRAKHFARLRNQLKGLLLMTEGDIFLSLDTDILLEDETILQQLVDTLLGERKTDPTAAWGWDVVAGTTFLHPWGEESECYNTGFFNDQNHGAFDQAWVRASKNETLVYKPPLRIDIPMAFFAIRRFALLGSSYRAHLQGEDVGFAQSLKARQMRVGWRPDLVGRHVWGPQWLGQEQAA